LEIPLVCHSERSEESAFRKDRGKTDSSSLFSPE
jgi:hypothetical protein